ncbi:MAG: hypothetical protein ACKOAX_09880, partial [Candidatus Kapaibacterium sp.]
MLLRVRRLVRRALRRIKRAGWRAGFKVQNRRHLLVKILVIQIGRYGDMILTTPLFLALRD